MKEIKMVMGFAKYEFEPNKFYQISQDNDFTYSLDFIDNTGKYRVQATPKANVKRLSTINKYLKEKGYEIEFVQD